ncbi:MAG: hypothetical protein GY796_25710 [Chloroflexi bacterium]|nr:hypothetical protein [Chloroflexota bacterium]
MKHAWKILSLVIIVLLVGVFVLQPAEKEQLGFQANGRAPDGSSQPYPISQVEGVFVSAPVEPTIGHPITEQPLAKVDYQLDREINPRLNLNPNFIAQSTNYGLPNGIDALLELQENAGPATVTDFLTPILNFDGQNYTGSPLPDTDGEIGPNHYVQIVNGAGAQITIYDKDTGNLLAGPTSISSFGSGNCSSGGGDGIVMYDWQADRWFMAEFPPFPSPHLCIYISTTNDPVTASWYAYDFQTPGFPDYPKYGVWPDAYYATSNENSPAVYALDRAAMLAGNAATFQRVTAPSLSGFLFQALTPSDLDGYTLPPAGSPNYIMRHRDDEVHNGSPNLTEDYLEIWEFDVDWTTSGNSTFTKVADLPIAEIDSDLCGLTSFFCFPQQGSGTTLDPLREVIMWRLQYRNFGSHEALVGNLVTDVDGTDHGGIRWFELRKSGANPWSLYQEGTYAPDANSRWMASIAMDGSGNMAMGYSVSSSSMFPSIRYVGRLSSDTLGTMPQGEANIVDGTSANGNNRWGDYSRMSVDPVDDCTFWYTHMYSTGGRWQTRISKLKFDQCGTADFTLSATPSNLDICTPNDAVYDINVGQVSGYTDTVTLGVTGNPAGTTAAFNPNNQATPYTSTLTISNTAAATAGLYDLEISGVAPTSTHTTTVSLNLQSDAPGSVTLTSPANGATNQPTSPTFTWQAATGASSYAIEIASDAGFSNIVESATGLTRPTYTARTTLNINTTYYWRVQAGNACGSGTYSAVYNFTVQPAPGDCSVGTTPTQVFTDDFESGASGWTHSGTNDTWILSGANVHSGAFAYHADDVNVVSDQYLVSPAIVLPTGESPLTLQFWNHQEMEDSSSGCFDGSVLEISTDGGSNWTRMETELLTDPYDGAINTSHSNPLAGENAWCGSPQNWLNSIVDLDAFAGDSVQFRFRLATDTVVSYPGWEIDDVVVQSCPLSSYAATLGPDTNMDASINGSVVHNFTLANVGVADDSYDLTLGNNSWPTTLLTASPIPVTAGMTATISVEVTAPNMPNVTDSFVITATSATLPTIVHPTATGTTNAVASPGIVVLSPPPQSGNVGTTITHTITVTNSGDYTDTFAVSISGNAWPTSGSAPSVGPLAPNESSVVEIYVTMGAAGSSDMATVTFTSGLNPTIFRSVTTTSNAQQFNLFLPMILKEN